MIPNPDAEVELSKERLLAAVGHPPDLTFLRSYGNIGDQLIFAGTRRLLSGIQYREVGIRDYEQAGGHTALISGGGAWCHPYHELMPPLLPRIEERFQRVIIFPSSFDPSEPSVRGALERTRALVFARERESYEQIRPLCQASLAHDCAFFFDYSPYLTAGEGTLTAYRTDVEAAGNTVPEGNVDISATCESLDEWLWAIARHREILTDRAHVMIAGALLGKTVRARASSYHKVPGIAEYSLGAYKVTVESKQPRIHAVRLPSPTITLPAVEIEIGAAATAVAELEIEDGSSIDRNVMAFAQESLNSLPSDFLARRTENEITIVMLCHGKLERTLKSIEAIKDNVSIPHRLILIDNGSGPEMQGELQRLTPALNVDLILLEENLGCGGGRMYSASLTDTPYIVFVDNDVEVLPGAVEQLLYSMESNPDVIAASGRILLDNGTIQLCGGDYKIKNGVMFHELRGGGNAYDDPSIGESGRCKWVSGTFVMIRREFIVRNPYDADMRAYYEDLEWCFNLNKRKESSFFRNIDALAIHHHRSILPRHSETLGERRRRAMRYLEPMAHFFKKHGLVIQDAFIFMPELGPPDSELSTLAAAATMALINSQGSDFVLQKWQSGELDPFFAAIELESGFRLNATVLTPPENDSGHRDAWISALARRITLDVEEIARLNSEIDQLNQEIDQLNQEIARSRMLWGEREEQWAWELAKRDQKLARIQQSLGWRALSIYGRFKYKFLLPIYRMFGSQSVHSAERDPSNQD